MLWKVWFLLALALGSSSFAETSRGGVTKARPRPQVALAPHEEITESSPTTVYTYHRVELGLVLGMALSSNTNSEPIGLKSATQLGFGAGLMFNFNLSPFLSLESGLHYAPRKLSFDAGVVERTETYQTLEFPLLARLWLGRIVSFGVGGYTSLGIGDIHTRILAQNAEIFSGDSSYDTNQLKSVDYGLMGSLQFRVPVSDDVSLLFDSRFNFGLRDLRFSPSDDDKSRMWRSLRFYAGAAIGL